MILTDNDIENIIGYFNRTLSDEDNQAFEQRIASDAAFRQAVYEYQATAAVLNTVRERKQKAFLKNIEATMPPVGIPIRRLDFRWWAVAAVGLVLVTVGIWQFGGGDTEGVKLKSIAANYFEPYPALGITKGENDATIKTNALRAYAVNDFKKAIPLLENAFDVEKDSMMLFYQSISYIGNGQSKEAIPILNHLKSSTFLSIESVEWYLALAYIEINQKEKALPLLRKVGETEGGHKREAKELFEKFK